MIGIGGGKVLEWGDFLPRKKLQQHGNISKFLT